MKRCSIKGGKPIHKNKHTKKQKLRHRRTVKFNLKKTYNEPKINRRTMRNRRQRGGNLLPQNVTNMVRGGQTLIVNTLNTLRGIPATPGPYPTEDQPIDQDVVVV